MAGPHGQADVMALADRPRIYILALAQGLRNWRRRLHMPATGALQRRIRAPERLVIAPPDLHTADPTIAFEIYAGEFNFCGKRFQAGEASPFRSRPPSVAWERELHGFSWLNHIAASAGPVALTNGQALVRDWLDSHGKPKRCTAWECEVAAARLISWTSHSPVIVSKADIGFYRQFMRSIATHMRFLIAQLNEAAVGMPRLHAAVAVAYGAVSGGFDRVLVEMILRRLDDEIERQILPDGGHGSRNPAYLPELLALLLPLRQAIAHIGMAPSQVLLSAIDRIGPAIRFLRLGDGNLVRMNGASATSHDLVATVLRYDNSNGDGPGSMRNSGYERLAMGGVVALVDAGRPPRGELSVLAHAGCLSFEMTCAGQPVIVNCGAPQAAVGEVARVARSTAAHSTATLNDVSSCRYTTDGFAARMLEQRIVSGPQRVTCERQDSREEQFLSASHDGYVRDFSVVHERQFRLADNGSLFEGIDRFFGPDGKTLRLAGRNQVSIRFHLHPSVACGRSEDGRALLLSAAGGVRFAFSCTGVAPRIDESMLFASSSGPRRTRQIELLFKLSDVDEVRWRFRRMS